MNLVRDQGLYLLQAFKNQLFKKLMLLRFVDSGGFHSYKIIYIPPASSLDSCLSAI